MFLLLLKNVSKLMNVFNKQEILMSLISMNMFQNSQMENNIISMLQLLKVFTKDLQQLPALISKVHKNQRA